MRESAGARSLKNVYAHCLKAEPAAESDQHKLLMQIQAWVLQKSVLVLQAVACLAETGTALFLFRSQFQPAEVHGSHNCPPGKAASP